MESCVIYARVSTKEQQDEGYSIPAQLGAIRAFCAAQNLSPVFEFVEAEPAGKAGRKRFTEMVDFLKANADVRVVVAHKLDRLYRNFSDQVLLEEIVGARARYVTGDVPDSPQGELLRDVQLSVAKFYLGNLAEEVRKGMDQKVLQGGWPHRAPVGYLNDKETRTIVVDPRKAPLVLFAFQRYASGTIALPQLADELADRGLVQGSGRKLGAASVQHILSNPIYCGRIRHKGALFPGAHEPLITPALFDTVQGTLSGKRNGTKSRRVFALRGVMYCAECGCLITAGVHRGHVYYRCTHGRGSCSNVAYTRSEVMEAQIDELLSRIELAPELIDALIADAKLLEAERGCSTVSERDALSSELTANATRQSKLLDAYLDGTVAADAYRAKSDSLEADRRALELRLSELTEAPGAASALVEQRARLAGGARLRFAGGTDEEKREVVSTVLCNVTVQDGRIASYQYKRPFGVLEQDSQGAFSHTWWAM
jgi:DNA invertase Pin-like site-specific DNA recombinase